MATPFLPSLSSSRILCMSASHFFKQLIQYHYTGTVLSHKLTLQDIVVVCFYTSSVGAWKHAKYELSLLHSAYLPSPARASRASQTESDSARECPHFVHYASLP